MLVTAMICGITGEAQSHMRLSDSEIRARARQLGMVEESEVLLTIPDTVSSGSQSR